MGNDISSLITELRRYIQDPKVSLPDELFYFISSVTPMINVDLLIKDCHGRTLLTWRDDRFHGPAWHLPGGIIRFKEKIEDRIYKVAETELGCSVSFAPNPIHVQGMINCERDIRGHFISLLYLCKLESEPNLADKSLALPQHGQWSWHDISPSNLLKVHETYRVFIDETPSLL